MTVPEAAEFLEISVASVYDLCASKKLKHYRLGPGGGAIRISREDAELYRESCAIEMRGTGDPKPIGPRHSGRLDGKPNRHI